MWNYRVVKSVDDGEEYFSIHEVYYNNDGSVRMMSADPIPVGGENVESLRSTLERMLECLQKDALVDGEIVFVEPMSAAEREGEG